MKRIIGFICFWIAVGMMIAMFISSDFFQILLIIGLLLIGFNLFCCDC